MSAALIELPVVSVEVVLCAEFRDGPVSGVIRAPALSVALPGVSELVYGPARRAWRSEPAAERTFLAAPVPAGTAQQLLEACTWPERWRAAPVFDVSGDPPPGHIGAMLGPFRADLAKTGPLVLRFDRAWTAIRAWRTTDNSLIDMTAAAALDAA